MKESTTQASQNKLFVFFVDPDTMELTLGLDNSQDANSIFEAIKKAFEKRDLWALLDKLIFLSSDGASVNGGKKIWIDIAF